MPTANVNGHDLHWVERGEGEPLLLIMGMSGTHLSWGDPFLDLLASDFRVIAYDHRGVGRSGRADAGYSIADLADDAAGLIGELALESVHVLGISMGGMVAQHLALRHLGRVRTLALGCTYSGGEGSALTGPAVLEKLQAGWSGGDREKALRAGWEVNVSAAFAGDEDQFSAFRQRAMDLPVPLPVIFAQMQAIGGHDVLARLEEIRAPTLVVHGTEDQMLPVANAHLIASRIPNARLEVLDGVGHMFWIERPERSADLLREHALTRTGA